MANFDPAMPMGQSIGTPRRGWLSRGTKLEPGRGYVVRHPHRVWGTEATVKYVKQIVDEVRAKHPRVHRLGIGDLSGEVGGLLRGHLSHQSGRDVDLGLFYRRRPRDYPNRFVPATQDNLHYKATWALLVAIAKTHDEPDGVDYALLDYRVQKLLHMWAQRNGVPQDELDSILQYPHGSSAPIGIVRHFPGHDDHLHVRFKCPPADPYCANPEGVTQLPP